MYGKSKKNADARVVKNVKKYQKYIFKQTGKRIEFGENGGVIFFKNDLNAKKKILTNCLLWIKSMMKTLTNRIGLSNYLAYGLVNTCHSIINIV
jgi:hypothetical protein